MHILPKLAITLVFMLPVVVMVSRCDTTVKTTPNEKAEFACMDAVQKILNDPDSAEFDYRESFGYPTSRDDVWGALVVVRAPNVYNAKIKAAFRCRVEQDADGVFVTTIRSER